MFNTLLHYVQRTWNLGPLGALKRIQLRLVNMFSVWSQSLLWGWISRNEMSDSSFLARTTGGWSSVDALLDHFASRSASSFLFPHELPQETVQLLNQYYPEHISAVLGVANAACRNEVILNGQVFNYPDGFDWHTEPVTGWHWPVWHVNRLSQHLGFRMRPADLRSSWELNRHQHFIPLGIAYWLTGEQKYVDAFSTQIQSWIKANPLQHGINWYSSLEISIRLIAWTAAFQFFRNSAEFRKTYGRIFLKSLWQQADFLSKHLQTDVHNVPNNHIIGELTGLVLVGSVFPEFSDAQAWRDTSLQMLDKYISDQTYLDGVNKEQAIGYHRFVAEFLLLIVARSRRGELSPQPILENALERMLDYVLFSLTPIGTAPMWGDSDNGRVMGLGLNKDFWDFRPLLAAGAVLLRRADWKFGAGHLDDEAYWFLGTDGLKIWEQLDVSSPRQTSRAFQDAGIYIIRDSWTADSDVAFFRCGPFGLGGEGNSAHAHCDLLSFVLWINGQPLLIDSGTYTYHGQWRNYFRLTGSHNTVMVDGREQASPLHGFSWQQTPNARCVDWTEKHVKGALTNFGPVEFIRELAHSKPGSWELLDKFIGDGEHKLEWFFHFAPDLDIQPKTEEHSLTVMRKGRPFLIMSIPDTRIRFEVRDTWCSYQYGIKQPNKELYLQWQGDLDSIGIDFRLQFQLVNEKILPEEGFQVNL